MEHELSQFEIPSRRLLANGAPLGECMPTDIGKAEIAHTFFGRARIRIVREQAKSHNKLLLFAVITAVVAGAVWHLSQQAEQPVEEVTPQPINEKVQISAPEFQPEPAIPPVTQPAQPKQPTYPAVEVSRVPAPVESYSAKTRIEPEPQKTIVPKDVVPVAARQEAPQPLVTNKPKGVEIVTSNNKPTVRPETSQQPVTADVVKQPKNADVLPLESQPEVADQEPDIQLDDPLAEKTFPVNPTSGSDQAPGLANPQN